MGTFFMDHIVQRWDWLVRIDIFVPRVKCVRLREIGHVEVLWETLLPPAIPAAPCSSHWMN